jgi:hypothetical protein
MHYSPPNGAFSVTFVRTAITLLLSTAASAEYDA